MMYPIYVCDILKCCVFPYFEFNKNTKILRPIQRSASIIADAERLAFRRSVCAETTFSTDASLVWIILKLSSSGTQICYQKWSARFNNFNYYKGQGLCQWEIAAHGT